MIQQSKKPKNRMPIFSNPTVLTPKSEALAAPKNSVSSPPKYSYPYPRAPPHSQESESRNPDTRNPGFPTCRNVPTPKVKSPTPPIKTGSSPETRHFSPWLGIFEIFGVITPRAYISKILKFEKYMGKPVHKQANFVPLSW